MKTVENGDFSRKKQAKNIIFSVFMLPPFFTGRSPCGYREIA
jgi:hypothetical protein